MDTITEHRPEAAAPAQKEQIAQGAPVALKLKRNGNAHFVPEFSAENMLPLTGEDILSSKEEEACALATD